MSNPSYSNFCGTLRALLAAKALWLADESEVLHGALTSYALTLRLSRNDAAALRLAAYLKNLGAIYMPSETIARRIEAKDLAHIKAWQLLSVEIATQAKLPDVALILEQYPARATPSDRLASIFQVVNCWVSCRLEKPYRAALTASESRLILEQRAEMGWSDTAIVAHFLGLGPE
jgi:hypothetical protein